MLIDDMQEYILSDLSNKINECKLYNFFILSKLGIALGFSNIKYL